MDNKKLRVMSFGLGWFDEKRNQKKGKQILSEAEIKRD